jgi:ParB family chromosome partitioning protein
MQNPEASGRVIGLQERPLGRTVLRTYRTKTDIDNLIPNPKQPRLGPKEDEELQRQIKENEGVFEPLLVEPHPEFKGKFRIVDGERRWTNSKALVANGKDQYRQLPVEVELLILLFDGRGGIHSRDRSVNGAEKSESCASSPNP